MKTVGELLKKTRLEKQVSLEEAEKATKIRVKHLDALEKGEYSKLPPPTFIKGFIKNYGQFLNLDEARLIAIFRREFDEKGAQTLLPEGVRDEMAKKQLKITPNVTITVAIVILVALFFGYLTHELLTFAGAPSLQIDSPENNQILRTQTVEVAGKTNPDSTLYINEQKVELKQDGSFKASVYLNSGVNIITISSSNKIKKTRTISRTVRVEPPR